MAVKHERKRSLLSSDPAPSPVAPELPAGEGHQVGGEQHPPTQEPLRPGPVAGRLLRGHGDQRTEFAARYREVESAASASNRMLAISVGLWMAGILDAGFIGPAQIRLKVSF